MDNLNIQVGDRITYKSLGKIFTELINSSTNLRDIEWDIEDGDSEILKIERIGENGWYTVYEKKDLLTDEEKEFLRDIIKYYDDTAKIEFSANIDLYNNVGYIICALDYPKKLKFENIEENKWYTLNELGLEVKT